jgi:hypothetical protein
MQPGNPTAAKHEVYNQIRPHQIDWPRSAERSYSLRCLFLVEMATT